MSEVVVKSSDMTPELQESAISISKKAIQDYEQPREISSYIKKEMDKENGHTWHCIVGKKFGSYVTHESGGFIYFYINEFAILLFKTN